jgi:23S rRNA (adenine1618-N6)-methyltransferase
MDRLTAAFPALAPYIIRTTRLGKQCRPTIDFSNREAVRALNTSLLIAHYGFDPKFSDILPADALFPAVPGRADYIHWIADVLLLSAQGDKIPGGSKVVGIDIGTGASAIYPTIAANIYGWKMIASEINQKSVEYANQIVKANDLSGCIDVRHQESENAIFDGVLRPDETIDFAMCNPPFYPTLEAYQKENTRKVKGLAKGGLNKIHPKDSENNEQPIGEGGSNNFGGSGSEFWCKGGEVGFIHRMIRESKQYADRCLWFSALVSRQEHLKQIDHILFSNMGQNKKGNRAAKQRKGKHIQMVQSSDIGASRKRATVVFWSYFTEEQQKDWARERGWG